MKEKVVRSYAEIKNSPKSWMEDFSHENGNYMNHCIFCESDFIGHKRRVVCKECWQQKTVDKLNLVGVFLLLITAFTLLFLYLTK